jgi:WD40 repeat protein
MNLFTIKRIARRALMAALAAGVLLLSAATPVYPVATLAWSKSCRVMAFSCDSGLYAADTVYGGVTRLSSSPAVGACSPDGLKVAWSEASGAYVYHCDRASMAKIAESARAVGWSPDSRWVLLELSPPGQAPDIYVADASGGSLVPLAADPAPDRNPAWSPDGRWIAFVSERDGSRGAIWVVGWDGSHLNRVTSMFQAGDPAWSPDGKLLAFAGQLSANSHRQIYCLDFHTGKLAAITSAADGDCRAPEFVGAQYLRYLGVQPMLLDLRSGERRKLPRGDLSPTAAVVAALTGSPGALELVSAKDGARRALDQGVEAVAWSPDGRWLAYLALGPGPGRDLVRELRFASPQAKGVFVLWSEGVRRRG